MQGPKNTHLRLSAMSLACLGWWLFITSAVYAQQAGQTAPGSSSRVVVEAGDLHMVLEKAQEGLRVLSPALSRC